MATDNRSLMSSAHQKAFSLATQLPPETIKVCRELTELSIARKYPWNNCIRCWQRLPLMS